MRHPSETLNQLKMTATLPHNEAERLAALAYYAILKTAPEPAFDDIALLAAQIGAAPIALLSFLDEEQQWVKAQFGFPEPSWPRHQGFCTQTILQDTPLVVCDAHADEFFRHAPLSEPLRKVRFYAGVPLGTEAGHVIGTLCLMDYAPRALAPRVRHALLTLARQVMHQLELRRQAQAVQTAYATIAAENEALRADKAALARSEDYHRALVEASAGSIHLYDLSGRCQAVNPAGAKALGYTPQEMVGRPLQDLLVPVRRSLVGPALAKILRERSLSGLTRLVAQDGAVRSFSYTAALCEPSGSEPFIVAQLHDVTRQQQQIRTLKKELRQAVLMARTKSEFLAGISHEIRTPLNGIIGMAQILSESSLSDTQREYVDILNDGADSLITFINDILDLSKIEAGMMTLEKVDFDLQSLSENIIKQFAERAHRKGLELTLALPQNVPRALLGDPGRLRQVLNNLISNAIKFTEQGEIAVQLEAGDITDDEITLSLTVRDTGVGIPADFLPHLYESFTQASTPGHRRRGGTGLGLAISKQLVEMMGGTLQVSSEVQRGTEFTFAVKLARQPLTVTNWALPPDDLRGLRVLIVDDNDTNRNVLHHQTISWGMIPTGVASAAEALHTLRQAVLEDQPFDVALIDWEMPEVDGIELARRIKAETALAGLPLILLASFGWRGQAQAARSAGLAAYLTKPIRQARLFECLVTVLGLSYAEQQPATQSPQPLLTRHNLKDYTPLSKPFRILLAEDNVVNQQIAVHQLYKIGYSVDIVGNGNAVLNALAHCTYDLVLMDCEMPEKDGYTATREIRQREAGSPRHTIIIAMTGHVGEDERARCLLSGMDDYLTKPLNLRELEETMARWLVMPETAVAVVPPVRELAATPDDNNDNTSVNAGETVPPNPEPDAPEVAGAFPETDNAENETIILLESPAPPNEPHNVGAEVEARADGPENVPALAENEVAEMPDENVDQHTDITDEAVTDAPPATNYPDETSEDVAAAEPPSDAAPDTEIVEQEAEAPAAIATDVIAEELPPTAPAVSAESDEVNAESDEVNTPPAMEAPEAEVAATPNISETAAPPAATEPPVIDLAVLARLVAPNGTLKPALAIELIDLFLSDAAIQRATLTQTDPPVSLEARAKIAHSLKSSSATMGARRLSSLCEDYQRQAPRGPASVSEAILAELLPELERVCHSLRVERQNLTRL